MITRHTFNETTWLDVLNPSTEEIREVLDECELPSSLAGDLTSMTPRTETLATNDAIKITLDFPIVKRTDINHPHEVKFIATEKHLVTVRFEDMELIHRFKKEFEVLAILKSAGKRATGGHLLIALLLFIYEGLEGKLDYLEGRLQEIEQNLFNGDERETLNEISRVGQRLISFRQTLSAHNRALDEFHRMVPSVFTKSYATRVDPIRMQYDHLIERVSALSRVLEILRDTDNALLSSKQNEIMKTLTIMAFITFPLTLMSSIFGMNTETMPIAGVSGDFWLIIGLMVLASIGFFTYFRFKKWI